MSENSYIAVQDPATALIAVNKIWICVSCSHVAIVCSR